MAFNPFSADYSAARTAFRHRALAAGFTLEAYPIDARGPNDEPLTIDVALTPRGANDRTLIVSSGLHGVEGFFGSALQVALLRDLKARIARRARPRIVLLHALNPYGFAWLRRVNEDNVDLNRNFLRDGEAFAGSPAGYAALESLLNSSTPPGSSMAFYLRTLVQIVRRGMANLEQSVAAGQYDYPHGLFFGGHAPTATHRILAAHLPDWIEGARRVVHLDLHTGLGHWATYRLFAEAPLTVHQRRDLSMWCKRQELVEPTSAQSRYTVRGGFGRWVADRFDRDYALLVAEFGTYHALRVIAGLRAENQAHHWSAADAVARDRTKAHLRELFFPTDRRWRTTCLSQGLEVVHRAIAALSGG